MTTKHTPQAKKSYPCVGNAPDGACNEPGIHERIVEDVVMRLCNTHAFELDAERAGEAWAEREAEAVSGKLPESWVCEWIDAIHLAPAGLSDQEERRFAELANDRARERWAELVAAETA